MAFPVLNPRSQQIYEVISPHIPDPLMDIILSYDKNLFTEENMAALNFLVKNVVGIYSESNSKTTFDEVVTLVDNLHASVKSEGLLELIQIQKSPKQLSESEQLEIAKRISVLNLVQESYSSLHRWGPRSVGISNVSNEICNFNQFYFQNCPFQVRPLPWVETTHNRSQELNENHLAQIKLGTRGLRRIHIIKRVI